MPHLDTDALADNATRQWGAGAVRSAAPADSADDKRPTIVLEPSDAAMLAAMLRWADSERLAILPRGGGTKLRWGPPPARLDAVLSTARLAVPIDHCSGDLVATVPAGASLASVNSTLALEHQCLPLDPPFASRATIGGIVATNDSGPRRHRYGAPRDLLIGIQMALVDGRLAKAGGRVVKNVAGYDLGRLLCGSFGSLAVVTSATFKLSPSAQASCTVAATGPNVGKLGELALALSEAPLTPSAIELDVPPVRLLVRFETTKAAADRQAAAAAAICERHGGKTSVLSGEAEHGEWRNYESRLWNTSETQSASDTIVKIGVLPTDVAAALGEINRVSSEHQVTWHAGGRAAVGVIVVRLSGGADKHPAVIALLRRWTTSRRGSAVIVSGESTVRSQASPWGDVGDALPMMQAVKARFDPHGTLSPGRGPGGF